MVERWEVILATEHNRWFECSSATDQMYTGEALAVVCFPHTSFTPKWSNSLGKDIPSTVTRHLLCKLNGSLAVIGNGDVMQARVQTPDGEPRDRIV